MLTKSHKKRAKSQKKRGNFPKNDHLNGHAPFKTGDFSTLVLLKEVTTLGYPPYISFKDVNPKRGQPQNYIFTKCVNSEKRFQTGFLDTRMVILSSESLCKSFGAIFLSLIYFKKLTFSEGGWGQG